MSLEASCGLNVASTMQGASLEDQATKERSDGRVHHMSVV
jgi:hypothetical protein